MNPMFKKIDNTDLRPIREIVLEELRNAIFEKSLKQGNRLVENIIASNMGVSRTPVREALRQLEIEGLAVNIPRKGTIVKGISVEDAVEIYDLREVLEGLAVRLACLNISRIEIRHLRETIDVMKRTMNENSYEQYMKAHGEYNNIIMHASKNKRLLNQIENIYEYLKSLRKVSLHHIAIRQNVLEEHESIVDAIELGDEVLAEKKARIHVINAKTRFIESYNE